MDPPVLLQEMVVLMKMKSETVMCYLPECWADEAWDRVALLSRTFEGTSFSFSTEEVMDLVFDGVDLAPVLHEEHGVKQYNRNDILNGWAEAWLDGSLSETMDRVLALILLITIKKYCAPA